MYISRYAHTTFWITKRKQGDSTDRAAAALTAFVSSHGLSPEIYLGLVIDCYWRFTAPLPVATPTSYAC